MKKFNDLYESDQEFARAVDTIREIASDQRNIDDDKKWNTLLNSLYVVLEKQGEESQLGKLSSAESE